MINNLLIQKVWNTSRKFLLFFTFLLSLSFAWQANFLAVQGIANAAILENNNQLLANIGDNGLRNQVEGRAQQDIGRVQSAIDDVGDNLNKAKERTVNKTDALSKQVQGRAQQDIGRTQDALQDFGAQVEDAPQNALEAVKNFFGQ